MDVKVAAASRHEDACRKKVLKEIYSIKEDEFLPGKPLWDSNLYQGNKTAITFPR